MNNCPKCKKSDEVVTRPDGTKYCLDCGERIALCPSDATACSGSSGVEAAVCEDIAKRQRVGMKKYGVSVADNPLDLRQWPNHAYEECLDQAVYLKRAMVELDRQNDEMTSPRLTKKDTQKDEH